MYSRHRTLSCAPCSPKTPICFVRAGRRIVQAGATLREEARRGARPGNRRACIPDIGRSVARRVHRRLRSVSFVLEGASFKQALLFVKKRAAERDQGIVEHVFQTSDAQLRAVFTEDFIAPIALAITGLGMALHEFTGKVLYDAVGSILIGVLMGVGGLILINLNRQFLAGMPLTAEQRAVVLGLLKKAPEIDRVTFLFAEFIGPDRLLLAARVSIAGD